MAKTRKQHQHVLLRWVAKRRLRRVLEDWCPPFSGSETRRSSTSLSSMPRAFVRQRFAQPHFCQPSINARGELRVPEHAGAL
jgi:hypothetical protein